MQICVIKFFKCTLYVFTGILGLLGIVIMIIGYLISRNLFQFNHFLNDGLVVLPIIFSLIGFLTIPIVIFGFYAVTKELKSLLLQYIIFLAIIFIGELYIGIGGIASKSKLEMTFKEYLSFTIERSSTSDLMAWDTNQAKFNCCGVNEIFDWNNLNRQHLLPKSCCRPQFIDIESNDCLQTNLLNKEKYFQEGCYELFKGIVDDNTIILTVFSIFLSCFQLIGIFTSISMMSSVPTSGSDTTFDP